jgi:hypothetical protein
MNGNRGVHQASTSERGMGVMPKAPTALRVVWSLVGAQTFCCVKSWMELIDFLDMT